VTGIFYFGRAMIKRWLFSVLELHKRNYLYVCNKQGNGGRICDKFDGCTAENTYRYVG